jgi:cell division protein FtsB
MSISGLVARIFGRLKHAAHGDESTNDVKVGFLQFSFWPRRLTRLIKNRREYVVTEKKKTNPVKLLPLLLFGIAVGVLSVHALNPARSTRLELLRNDHQRLKSAVNTLRRDNVRLQATLKSLEEGTAGWRDVARREFGLLGPGEIVFRFPTKKTASPPSDPPSDGAEAPLPGK